MEIACPGYFVHLIKKEQIDEAEAQLVAIFAGRQPEMIGNEYLVIGTLERSDWKRGTEEALTLAETLEGLHDFSARFQRGTQDQTSGQMESETGEEEQVNAREPSARNITNASLASWLPRTRAQVAAELIGSEVAAELWQALCEQKPFDRVRFFEPLDKVS